MSAFFASHHELCLAAAILFSRAADLLSTRFVTPTLLLEMNPLARRLGWPFGWASLLLCFLPFAADWGPAVAVPVIVMSLLVAGQNVSRGWPTRTLGEKESLAFVLGVYARARPALVYGSIATGGMLTASAGGLGLMFYPDPDAWGHYFALGVVLYGVALALHGSLNARRMFRTARGEA